MPRSRGVGVEAPALRRTPVAPPAAAHWRAPAIVPMALTPERVLHLQRSAGNRAVGRLLDPNAPVVERAFRPGQVTAKAHLRPMTAAGVGHKKTGRVLKALTPVVFDDAQQLTVGAGGKAVTWDRAVDKRPEAWTGADKAAGGYIRHAKVTGHAPYPRQVTVSLASRGQLAVQQRWHENVGEYAVIGKSLQTPTDDIVKVQAGFRRLDGGYALHQLTPLEFTQVDDVSRDSSVLARLRIILTNAANAGGLNPRLFDTHENVGKLFKPLRTELASHTQQERDRWNEWSQAVFAKIAQGASELVASINHWKATVYPPNVAQCQVAGVELEGSDLHDRGLGAVFVTYRKPNDNAGMFPGVASVKVVLKPEDRDIEKALFGTQQGSLATEVNRLAGLQAADAISTIKMETHANYGSIIEFVRGKQARRVAGAGADSQAMSEGIAFAFLAGMSDVHQDNVIWHKKKPYFIDADNSLNAARLGQASSQSGFSEYNKQRTQTDIADINTQPQQSRSLIIQALLADATPFAQALTNAFQGKTGRVVPLFTNFWANQLKMNNYIGAPDGGPGDSLNAVFSRWAIANMCAAKLPNGDASSGTGLVGEAGIGPGGHAYAQNVEAAQVKSDLDEGKIPFFNYQYTTGYVTHNGQAIWHGQTIAQAVAILLTKFPPPPDTG